jgi:hypothetical protein
VAAQIQQSIGVGAFMAHFEGSQAEKKRGLEKARKTHKNAFIW